MFLFFWGRGRWGKRVLGKESDDREGKGVKERSSVRGVRKVNPKKPFFYLFSNSYKSYFINK